MFIETQATIKELVAADSKQHGCFNIFFLFFFSCGLLLTTLLIRSTVEFSIGGTLLEQ